MLLGVSPELVLFFVLFLVFLEGMRLHARPLAASAQVTSLASAFVWASFLWLACLSARDTS